MGGGIQWKKVNPDMQWGIWDMCGTPLVSEPSLTYPIGIKIWEHLEGNVYVQ